MGNRPAPAARRPPSPPRRPPSPPRIVYETVYVPAPPPPPPPTFDSEWRNVEWDKKDALLEHMMEYNREDEDIKHIRILLSGQVGAGKSSFVNSVDSIFKGRMAQRASVGTGDGSHTLKYKTYRIRKENRCYFPFVFSDLMGLEETAGIQEEDIKLTMKGCVKEGYTFNPAAAISDKDPFYNNQPKPEDQTHILVCVVPADKVDILTEKFAEKIQRIRNTARDLGIPQICIVTNIDNADPLMKKDVKNVYKLKIVKKKMEEFSAKVGIPMNSIFPVKNYNEETELNDAADVLILKALQHMINLGEDFIEDM